MTEFKRTSSTAGAANDWGANLRTGREAAGSALADQVRRMVGSLRDAHALDRADVVQLQGEIVLRGDALSIALMNYVAGSERIAGIAPRTALALLGHVERHARQSHLEELSALVRIEAAHQVRSAGFSQLAWDLISNMKEVSGRVALEVLALQLLCLLDLGRPTQAMKLWTQVQSSDSSANLTQGDALARLRTLYAAAQLELTLGLSTQGIRCHLAHASETGSGQPATPDAQAQAWAATDALGALIAELPRAQLTEEHAFLSVTRIARDQHVGRQGQSITQLATTWVTKAHALTAQTWLWLGLANSVMGRFRSAMPCLLRASELASEQGIARVHRLALQDLALACEQVGDVAARVAAQHALHDLDQAMVSTTTSWAAAPPWATTSTVDPCPDAISNRHVRRAIELLDGQRRSTTVETLARACEVSRRTLEKAFRAEFGITVRGFIKERRVQTVKGLLTTTKYSVKLIAAEAGYPSASALCHEFKRFAGVSPSQYREEINSGRQCRQKLGGFDT